MADTVEEIFYNISTWKEVLQFPDLASIGEDEVSPAAMGFMKKYNLTLRDMLPYAYTELVPGSSVIPKNV